MHLHIFEGITEDDLKTFFSNTLGSKHFNLYRSSRGWDSVFSKIADTPNVWIGEVSWLKAAFCDNDETFIPNTVGEVHDIIGEDLPVIDDELIQKILKAFDLENKTSYSLAKKEDIEKFLLEHKGKKAFTVSW